MDTSTHTVNTARRRSIRALALGVALVAAGVVAPTSAMANSCGDLALHAGMAPNARSIALTEGLDPGNCPAGDGATFVPVTQNQLSIMRTESNEPPGGVRAGGVPGWAQTTNDRSIALIESKEAPGGILAGGSAPPARVPYEESEHAVSGPFSESAEEAAAYQQSSENG